MKTKINDAVMATPIQTPIDPVNPLVTQAEETGSLADFADKYAKPEHRMEREDPEALDRETAPVRSPRQPRGRGQDDHETISALTKRLRDAEAQIGVNTERLDGESDRAFNLRLRAEAAEAVAKKASERQEPKQAAQSVEQPSAFTDKEPTIEQFADQADPYSAWQRAVNAWDRKKERFDDEQKKATASSEERVQAGRKLRAEVEKAHFERIEAFKIAQKDYVETVNHTKNWPPPNPLLEIALINDEQGVQYIYGFAKNQALYDEFMVMSDGKTVNRQNVEAIQRILKARMPAVTGSAHTPAIVNFPPPPPNPVRTGRMRSSNSEPPDIEHQSLDDFARTTSRRTRR